MLDLNDFFYFVQVVDRGGFTAAGRELRIPKSTLSHRLKELEKSLGVRLLNRTSRRFGMTDAGSEFYRHAVATLLEAEQAETAMRRRLHEPSGTVRCTASIATMQFAVSEVVSSFLATHPKVTVVAHATNQLVDLVRERSKEVEVPISPRFISDDMKTLKRAAVAGLGIVSLPGYVCREEVRSGTLRRVLPDAEAEDSTLTALMPNREGVLPSVRAFIKHLAAELPKVVTV